MVRTPISWPRGTLAPIYKPTESEIYKSAGKICGISCHVEEAGLSNAATPLQKPSWMIELRFCVDVSDIGFNAEAILSAASYRNQFI